jgi:hypothetical protein
MHRAKNVDFPAKAPVASNRGARKQTLTEMSQI